MKTVRDLWQFKYILIVFLVTGLTFAALWIFTTKTEPRADHQAQAKVCNDTYVRDANKIDCWLLIVDAVFAEDGTSAAFDLFYWLYREYDTFANTGCHRHAHRIGDMAFYHDYLLHKDVSRVDFPASANACGYGFYHGFVEHMVQDNPTVEFVEATCAYMGSELKGVAPAISKTCYHGSGHGFLLAERDNLLATGELDVETLIAGPLSLCDALSRADEGEYKECAQGVFTVLVEWMVDNEYGLSYNAEEPFKLCDGVENKIHRQGCYSEFSQKLDSVSGYSVSTMHALIQKMEDESARLNSFGVGVAGLVQHNPDDSHMDLFQDCRSLPDDYAVRCLMSIVGGKFEHGQPGAEYKFAQDFCSTNDLSATEEELCYTTMVHGIKRFFNESEHAALCKDGSLDQQLCALL